MAGLLGIWTHRLPAPPCPRRKQPSVRSASRSAAEPILAAAFQCAPVGWPGVDALQEGAQARVAAAESAARGEGLERKAELDVGGAERIADEPFALTQFGVEIVQVQLQLGIGARAIDLVRAAAGDRLHE